MEWLKQNILTIVIVISIVFLGWAVWATVSNMGLSHKLQEAVLLLQTKKHLPAVTVSPGSLIASTDTVSRAEFNKQLDEIAAKDSEIKRLLSINKMLKQEVTTITKTEIKLVDRIVYRDQPSDGFSESLFRKTIIYQKLELADVSFDLKKPQKPWSYETKPLTVQLHILQSVSDKPKPDRVSISAKLIDHKGVASEVKVNAKTVFAFPKKSIPRWQLRLSPMKVELAAGPYIASSEARVGVQLTSHLLKLEFGDKDIFRFLGIGLGYGYPNHLLVSGQIVSWNLSTIIPGLRDTFIGFGLGIATDFKTVSPAYFLTLQTTL